MHKSSARLIFLSFCFPGVVLAQGASAVNSGTAVAANAAATDVTYTPTVPSQGISQSTNYILGSEDLVTVRIFAADDIPDKPSAIANDGTVTLPMIGQVKAAGLTVEQFEQELTAAYKKYFKDPQVTVTVSEYRSQPVSVAGNVATPGVVQLRGQRNLMEVISQAGGLRADAGDTATITRNLSEGPIPVSGAFTDPSGKYSVAHINIRNVMSGKDPEDNIMIKPHDVVTIPRARMVYVLGNVTKPGGYVMTDNDSMSLTQAIALAGGWDKTAALHKARVLRASVNGGEREEISADVKAIMDSKAPDLQLRPDDILYVPNSLGKSVSMRSMEAAIAVGTGVAIWH
jgi:polysaccharide export outer membrane protein